MKFARTLLMSVAASAAMTAGAMAADMSDPYVPYTPMAPAASAFSFEGFYFGVIGGGLWDSTSSYLTAPDTAAWSLGAAAGVNFYLTDSVLGGFEVQGSGDFGATNAIFDGFALGRLGLAPTNEVMVYLAGGPGFTSNTGTTTGVYGIGGGVEVAAWDQVSLRGEVLGIGTWGAAPNAVKATAGVMFHMN